MPTVVIVHVLQLLSKPLVHGTMNITSHRQQLAQPARPPGMPKAGLDETCSVLANGEGAKVHLGVEGSEIVFDSCLTKLMVT